MGCAVGDALAVAVGVGVGVALLGDALAVAVGDAFGDGVGVEELLTPEEITGATLPPPPPHPASNEKRTTTDARRFTKPRNRMIATPPTIEKWVQKGGVAIESANLLVPYRLLE